MIIYRCHRGHLKKYANIVLYFYIPNQDPAFALKVTQRSAAVKVHALFHPQT